MATQDTTPAAEAPWQVFRFLVTFQRATLPGTDAAGGSGAVDICQGGFSECTGLEATMEPKAIKAGGMNYGAAQRVGHVSFATVVLKRGMTSTRHLWEWFARVAGGASAYRLDVRIQMHNGRGEPVLTWLLERALPVKFKAADVNARGTEIGIEELHLVHEGLRLESSADGEGGGTAAPAAPAQGATA